MGAVVGDAGWGPGGGQSGFPSCVARVDNEPGCFCTGGTPQTPQAGCSPGSASRLPSFSFVVLSSPCNFTYLECLAQLFFFPAVLLAVHPQGLAPWSGVLLHLPLPWLPAPQGEAGREELG